MKDRRGNVLKRGEFNLHTGSRSDGCVTVRSDQPETMRGTNGQPVANPQYPSSAAFNIIKGIINNTSPYAYKGQTGFKGILKVVP